jgi:hypothetical protein
MLFLYLKVIGKQYNLAPPALPVSNIRDMAMMNAGPLIPNEIEWPGNILTWTVTILACAHIAWLEASL